MGILYVVGTPIGNLEDITYRAVRILCEVDVIACEDTRQTKKLLDRYQIRKTLISYHQHSKIVRINEIVEMLKSGKNVALVTDAGTPGINDPGGMLINKTIEQLSNITIVPIPGASALTTLLSVSGIPADRFLFLGFLPKKKGRTTLISNIQFLISNKRLNMPIVIYESPHRVIKTLEDFAKITCPEHSRGDNFNVIIGRELTKRFEEIIRGKIKDVITDFKINKYKSKGEFTIILERNLCLNQE